MAFFPCHTHWTSITFSSWYSACIIRFHFSTYPLLSLQWLCRFTAIIINGVLLYKQIICLAFDSAWLVWRSSARSHWQKLQMLQSKRHAILTKAPWCISNTQIHASLAVPFFADHITALTENFASKLSGVWHQLVWCLGRGLCWSLWGNLKVTHYCNNRRWHVSKPVETVRNKLTKSVAR
jgi:hypothetical protein